MSSHWKAAAAGLGIAFAVSAVAKPVTWWASYPVKPGEHVLVSGGGWAKDVKVRLADRTLEPTTVSETGVTFKWPAEMTEPMPAVVLKDAEGASEPIVLNAPTVWWAQGDDFDASSPGSAVRFFGRCLDVGKAEFVGSDGSATSLKVTQRDVWSCTAEIPKDMKPGAYAVRLDGRETDVTWRVKVVENLWGDKVFKVVDFGAVPDDGKDDDKAVHAAIDAAKAAGGGTVLFPRGRIDVHSELEVPRGVLLKGESRDASGLYWADFFNPPPRLVNLNSRTGIEDLYLSCGLFARGIRMEPDATDIALRRLRVRFLTNQWRDSCGPEEFLRRYNMGGQVVEMYRGGRLVLEDVDLYADKNDTETPRLSLNATDVVIRGCDFRGTGWCRFSIRRALVENNRFATTTCSIVPGTAETFWSRNEHSDRYAGDAECITHDLRSNAYWEFQPGGVVEGTHVRFDVPKDIPFMFPNGSRNAEWNRIENWVGGNVQIVAGRGLGQVRRIARVLSRTEFEIDRPFDLVPDASSRFSVRFVRRHIHYVNNVMRDTQIALQIYGGATDCVCANNLSLRSGGFTCFGINRKGGVMPVMDVQFLGNEIRSPLQSYRSYERTERMACIGHAGKTRWKYPDHFARGLVIRGNTLEGAALGTGCPDVIAEGNVVRHAKIGVLEPGFSESHVIAGNRFDDVQAERAKSWPAAEHSHFERELAWIEHFDAVRKVTVREAAFEVKGETQAAIRYWPNGRMNVWLDCERVYGPDSERRLQMTCLVVPGTHRIRIEMAGDPKETGKLILNLEVRGDADRVKGVPMPKRVLLVSKVHGYNHRDGIAKGDAAIKASAIADGDFTVEVAEDFDVLAKPGFLDRFDAIVLNNTTGVKAKAFPGLEEALTSFVKGGKGLALLHSAVDAFYDSEAIQEMNGGLFFGHPWYFEGKWRFVNERPDDPLNASFKGAKEFSFGDEIYMQKSPPYDRKDCTVLVSLSKTDAANKAAAEKWRTNPNPRVQAFPIREDGDFAVSWVKPYGKGRVFYTSFGHDGRAFTDPAVYGHILAGIRHCLGL